MNEKRSVSISDAASMNSPGCLDTKGRRFSCPAVNVVDNAIVIKRPPFTQTAFDDIHAKTEFESKSISERLKKQAYCSKKRLWKLVSGYLPILKVLRYYNIKENILIDILAGLTIGVLHIPQALAFGQLTSVKIENGLYTSLWPVIIYVFFGTSAHVSIGTSAVICILTASVVDRQGGAFVAANPDILNFTLNGTQVPLNEIPAYLDYKEGVAMAVTFVSGLMMIFMGVFKLGFITAYLSESFFCAFTSGAAIHIATSQVPAMLGLDITKHGGLFKFINNYIEIFSHITEVNVAAIVCAVITCLIIVLVKDCINERFKHKLFMPIPIELFVVVFGCIVGYFGDLNTNFGIAIVGSIPNTIPPPVIPPLAEAPDFLADCFIIAILIFANTIAMAKICAKKHNYEVDDSQELIAYGMCNFVSSFFKCFPSSVAPPRSMVSSGMNTKTVVNGIFTSGLMVLVIMVISFVFEVLPKSILAAIIFIALKGLFIQILDGRKFWRVNKFDFVIWFSTFTSAVFLDIDYGLFIGVGVSLITVVFQTQFARGYRLGRTMKDSTLVEHKKYQDSVEIPGVKIFRFESSLYYANAEIFRSNLYRCTVNPRKLLKMIKKYEKKMGKSGKSVMLLSEERRSSVVKTSVPSTNTTGTTNLSTSENNLTGRMNSTESTKSDSTKRNSGSSMDNPVFTITDEAQNNSYTLKQNGFNADGSMKRHGSIDSTFSTVTITTINSEDEEVDPEDGGILVTDEKLRTMRRTHHVIVDCSVINYLDASGANVLSHIFTEYDHVNIKLFLCGCSYGMREAMKHAGVFNKIPQENIFLDLYDALAVAKIQRAIPMLLDVTDYSDDEAAEDSYITKL
ncbi:prestin-like [Haliotis cracherodii]|uniref:prestin-like n=1 Tax=Haliotis cracherodii TaxID=6455 RepID=UPI0039E87CE4